MKEECDGRFGRSLSVGRQGSAEGAVSQDLYGLRPAVVSQATLVFRSALPRPNAFPQSSAVRYNTRIGIGGDLVVFDLEWHVDVIKTDMAKIKHRQIVGYKENPRLAWTVDMDDTNPPS